MKKASLLLLLLPLGLAACTPDITSTTSSRGRTSTGGKDFVYKGLDPMSNYGSESGKIKFQVGGGNVEMALWDKLIRGFNQVHPEIEIEKVTINDPDALYTALAGGNAPDVIQVESPNFGSWTKNGALQSIQPFVEQENFDLSDYWEQAIEMYSFNTETGIRGNGDLFCLPKDFGVNGIFVNRKIVNDAKKNGKITEEEYALVTDQVNPMTFDQYINIAVKLSDFTTDPAVPVYGSNRIYWESYIWSAGEDILDENYQLNVNNQVVKDCFQYSLDMVTKGNPHYCAPYSAASSSASQDEMSMFNTGKIAMYWSGRWLVPSYDAGNINYYCIPTPVVVKSDGTKGVSSGWCSTIGYGIARNCKNTKMAYTFIKYLASDEAYRIMNELNYAVPGKKSIITEDKFADPKTYNGSRCLDRASASTFFEAAKHARLNNGARFTTSRWIDAFEAKLDLLFTGDIPTVDEFLSSVRGEVNNALRNSDPQLFK